MIIHALLFYRKAIHPLSKDPSQSLFFELNLSFSVCPADCYIVDFLVRSG